MSRAFAGALLAVFVLAVSPGLANADEWGFGAYSCGYSYAAYYYAPIGMPVYYYVPPPVYVVPAPACAPVVTGPYAQPQPAPASPAKQRPVEMKKPDPPKVSESQAYSVGAAKSITQGTEINAKDTCRVGFWNVTGRDLKLIVNGKAYVLPRDRNLTVTTGRSFTWQFNGRDSHVEKVADDHISHEIVIR